MGVPRQPLPIFWWKWNHTDLYGNAKCPFLLQRKKKKQKETYLQLDKLAVASVNWMFESIWPTHQDNVYLCSKMRLPICEIKCRVSWELPGFIQIFVEPRIAWLTKLLVGCVRLSNPTQRAETSHLVESGSRVDFCVSSDILLHGL